MSLDWVMLQTAEKSIFQLAEAVTQFGSQKATTNSKQQTHETYQNHSEPTMLHMSAHKKVSRSKRQ
jgi:hypothetical protein